MATERLPVDKLYRLQMQKKIVDEV